MYRATGPLFFHCLDCDFHIGLRIGLPHNTIQVYTDPYSFIIIIIIIKYIYIVQDREKLQICWLTVTNGTGMS